MGGGESECGGGGVRVGGVRLGHSSLDQSVQFYCQQDIAESTLYGRR